MMRRSVFSTIAALLLALALPALAQDEQPGAAPESGNAPAPPEPTFQPRELPPIDEDEELPEKVRPPDELEPEVRIHRDEDGNIVEEYRLNGLLYMVKVTPQNGLAPWYLIDTDGDGQLEQRRDELGPHLNVPHWVLIEW